MLKLPKPTPAPAIASKPLVSVAYLYIVALVFLVLWQLISLNNFVTFVASYLGGTVDNTALSFALTLIATEFFALPFLLRLKLSPLARLCSAACVLLVPIIWSVLTLLNQPSSLTYLIMGAVALLWGAVAFWAMGGVQALTPKLK
jgi:hypothetical protein